MAAGHALFEHRRALGLSQQNVADALQVERSTVGRWENGDHAPALHLRSRLAKLLKITPTQLAGMLTKSADHRPAAQRPETRGE